MLDDRRLSQKARDLLLDEGNNIYYSAVSVLEVDMKTKSRNKNLEFTTDDFIEMCNEAGYYQLSLDAESISRANYLEWAGEGRGKILIAPQWSGNKKQVWNCIRAYLVILKYSLNSIGYIHYVFI